MKKQISIAEALVYLDKMGIKYTVENNPSPEEIKRIQDSIKRSEEMGRLIAGRVK